MRTRREEKRGKDGKEKLKGEVIKGGVEVQGGRKGREENKRGVGGRKKGIRREKKKEKNWKGEVKGEQGKGGRK